MMNSVFIERLLTERNSLKSVLDRDRATLGLIEGSLSLSGRGTIGAKGRQIPQKRGGERLKISE
jgi:hypothetical protein